MFMKESGYNNRYSDGLQAGRLGFYSRHGMIFSGDHPAFYPAGTGDDFTAGVKRPGCESDNSPTSSPEVKNGGAIPPLKNSEHLTFFKSFRFSVT
jgi:hypothetical protein